MDITNTSYILNQSMRGKGAYLLLFAIGMSLVMVSIFFIDSTLGGLIWVVLPPFVAFVAWVWRSEKRMLFSYIAISVAVQFKPKENEISELGMLDALVGIVMILMIIHVFIKSGVFGKRNIVTHKYQLLALVYVMWVSITGLAMIFLGNHSFNEYIREFLRISPMLVLPIVIPRILTVDDKSHKQLFQLLICIWIFVFIGSIYHVRSTFLSAFYLFEVRFALFDVANSPFMIYLFIVLSGFIEDMRKQKYYIIALLVSLISLGLTFNRTAWLATIILVPILVLASAKEERKKQIGVIFKTTCVILLLFTIGYFLVPVVQLMVKWFLVRFLSAGMGKADASVANRFYEWEQVMNFVVTSPVFGGGLGGKYSLYSPFIGIKVMTGYTHSGPLGPFLKGGVVGAIMLFTTYFGFLYLGVKLSIRSSLSLLERSLSKMGTVFLILSILYSMTFNVFMHREVLWYITLVWGYFIYLDNKQSKQYLNQTEHIG